MVTPDHTGIMRSSGAGEDDHKQPCPRCREYIEQTELVMETVDAIESRMNELKEFFAKHEWVLIENADNIRKLHNPAKEMDMDSLQRSHAQGARFKRLTDSALRSLMRLRSLCDDFGGLDENL